MVSIPACHAGDRGSIRFPDGEADFDFKSRDMSNTTDLQKCMWFRPYYVQKVRFLPFFFFTAMSDWSADRVLFIKAPVACPWVGSNHQPFQRHVKHSWTRKMPVIQDVFWAKVRVLERFFSWQWVTCLWLGFSLQKHPSLGGLEPPTFRLTAERANRLRHRDNMRAVSRSGTQF